MMHGRWRQAVWWLFLSSVVRGRRNGWQRPALERLEPRTVPGFITGVATYPAGGYPLSLAEGDFNGDGFPDVAVANPTDIGLNGRVTVMLNAADWGLPQVPAVVGVADPLPLAVDANGPTRTVIDAFPIPVVASPNPFTPPSSASTAQPQHVSRREPLGSWAWHLPTEDGPWVNAWPIAESNADARPGFDPTTPAGTP